MSDDSGVQLRCETAPSIYAVYEEEERLDWGTDDDKSHAVDNMPQIQSHTQHH